MAIATGALVTGLNIDPNQVTQAREFNVERSLRNDLGGLFREMHRIQPEHVALMRRVKPLIGAIGTPTPRSLVKALEDAGFVRQPPPPPPPPPPSVPSRAAWLSRRTRPNWLSDRGSRPSSSSSSSSNSSTTPTSSNSSTTPTSSNSSTTPTSSNSSTTPTSSSRRLGRNNSAPHRRL
ncbi:hypothetical protein B0T24DRAFT_712071 [Lasiosphaeria ovina]|uniref:Uncharacterized protein n=1 Tax=Lasiosphaeria ovina TaxID=92902 RepID=A0AAE0JVK3_9PEZI|nr:hypothetical protein B0T24DRAFT_712071 [Lasiosphaeria ovina]